MKPKIKDYLYGFGLVVLALGSITTLIMTVYDCLNHTHYILITIPVMFLGILIIKLSE